MILQKRYDSLAYLDLCCRHYSEAKYDAHVVYMYVHVVFGVHFQRDGGCGSHGPSAWPARERR